MRDVAARAGVSPRTVSNVVSGYVHVAADTRQRVQEAIDELRYRPNISARSLRQGRTGIIALAVPEIASPYFAELADLVQREAERRGITLLIDQTRASREREVLVLDGYHSNVIDGLIMSPMAITAADLRQRTIEIPTVLLGERIDASGGLLHVTIDNVEAARQATAHLVGSGRRRIAALGVDTTPDNVGPASRRLLGHRLALADAGLPQVRELELAVDPGDWSHATGAARVEALLRDGPPFDAVFCFNDVLAFGAVRALQAAGRSVPEDVAVVGWDDIADAAYYTPSLTSLRPDKAAIALSAVDRLLALIAGEPSSDEQITCPFSLVVRESSAGPPPRAPRPARARLQSAGGGRPARSAG